MAGEIEDNVAIQIQPPGVGQKKKRGLKNKNLSVSFNEKDLRDYVTGFHKRKKKRRKEYLKNQEEKLRLKRIAARKQRKLERELALNGGALPATDESEEDDEESEPFESINGTTTMYDDGDMQVSVTTSEISREDEDGPSEKTQAAVPMLIEADKKHKLSVSKKKSFKKVSKRKSRSKPQNKRDKRKGKTKNKKR